MSLEINGLNTSHANNSKAKTAGQINKTDSGGNANTPANSSSVAKETVVISAEAKSLSKISAEVSTEAPVNQAKVDAIRAAINDGSFSPNAENIANKLIGTDDLF